jgi:thiol-disulfide isomerase/thioredoxin
VKAIILLLLAPLAATAQGTFELSGRVDGKDSGAIYLTRATSLMESTRDSATLVNGAFTFRGPLDGATRATLHLSPRPDRPDDPNVANLWIEEGRMTIRLTFGNFKDYRLTGSPTDDENKAQEAAIATAMKEMMALSDQYYATKETDEREAIRARMAPFQQQIRESQERHVREHPDSHLSAYYLLARSSSLSLEEGEACLAALSERVRRGTMGKALAAEVEKLRAGSPGSAAALFSKEDINGKTFELASLVGKKYILLDFWASWCVPCRQGNPHMKQLYEQYKEGLAIVCISDDDSTPDKWRAAVEQDGLQAFYHVLRGLKRTANGFDRSGDIDELYAIHSLPTKILVDLQGKIVGRYVGNSPALDEQLKTIFGK